MLCSSWTSHAKVVWCNWWSAHLRSTWASFNSWNVLHNSWVQRGDHSCCFEAHDTLSRLTRLWWVQMYALHMISTNCVLPFCRITFIMSHSCIQNYLKTRLIFEDFLCILITSNIHVVTAHSGSSNAVRLTRCVLHVSRVKAGSNVDADAVNSSERLQIRWRDVLLRTPLFACRCRNFAHVFTKTFATRDNFDVPLFGGPTWSSCVHIAILIIRLNWLNFE